MRAILEIQYEKLYGGVHDPRVGHSQLSLYCSLLFGYHERILVIGQPEYTLFVT